ncbi:hypothetical protein [Nocardioides sp. SYSU DS0663]|uniref:hypothetical protein n=1 Tax=Nocardioides sp. SYSU DS0663 TaxID=3416445 RepID=UPI003F4B4091
MARTPYIVVPLLVAVALSGATGARMLLSEPDPADAGATVECWDGLRTDSLENCSRPRSEEGLAWVFPSLDTAECEDPHPDRTGPAKVECEESIGRKPVTIRYGAVGEVEGGRSYFEKTYADGARAEAKAPDGSVNRYVWRLPEPTPSGDWVLTSMYREHPFFVTVEAPTARARDRAFKRFVEMRDPGEVRGTVIR